MFLVDVLQTRESQDGRGGGGRNVPGQCQPRAQAPVSARTCKVCSILTAATLSSGTHRHFIREQDVGTVREERSDGGQAVRGAGGGAEASFQ